MELRDGCGVIVTVCMRGEQTIHKKKHRVWVPYPVTGRNIFLLLGLKDVCQKILWILSWHEDPGLALRRPGIRVRDGRNDLYRRRGTRLEGYIVHEEITN
jgi:hypothetical protein